jgi:hypothetical protein
LFAGIVFAAIGLAALNDGVQTYPAYKSNQILNIADFILLMIFTLEVLLKVAAFGSQPWRYWIGRENYRWIGMQVLRGVLDSDQVPKVEEEDFIENDRWWNCFDFTVVCVCFVGLFGGGSSIGFLRVLRLMRIIRLLRFWTELQSILKGLMGGLKASLPIIGLLLFIFFLYGTIGVTTFRENDPFHFKTLEQAMITLYTITNLEWLDVAAINMYGCSHDNDIYTRILPADTDTANPELFFAMMEAPLPEQYRVINEYYEGKQRDALRRMQDSAMLLAGNGTIAAEIDGAGADMDMLEYMPMEPGEFACVPKEQTVAAIIYFVTFVIVGPLVMTTLFTGAVSMSMTHAVMDLQRQAAGETEGAEMTAANEARQLAKDTFTGAIVDADDGRSRAATDGELADVSTLKANGADNKQHRRGQSMPAELSGPEGSSDWMKQVVNTALDKTIDRQELEKSVGIATAMGGSDDALGPSLSSKKGGGFGQKKVFDGRMQWLEAQGDLYLMLTGEHRLRAALCSIEQKQLLLGQMLTARTLERLFRRHVPVKKATEDAGSLAPPAPAPREAGEAGEAGEDAEHNRYPGVWLKAEVIMKWDGPFESAPGGCSQVYRLCVNAYARYAVNSWHVMRSSYFKGLVNATIAFAALMVGLQTGDPFANYGVLLVVNEYLCKIVFLAEFLVKIGAEGSVPQAYFYEGWNCFGEWWPVYSVLLSHPRPPLLTALIFRFRHPRHHVCAFFR